jgi:hypothetical protein
MDPAGLNNSRCDSLIGFYGISERLFLVFRKLSNRLPEIVVNDQGSERGEFRIIDARDTSRPSDLWGRAGMEGAFRKRSYALAHAHSLKFELDFKKNKIGHKKIGLSANVRVDEDRGN